MPYSRNKLSMAVIRIRDRLKASGVSRDAWAKRSGVKEGTIRAIEDGRTKAPTIETLHQLADGAGVPLWELLGEDVYWRDEYFKLRAALEVIQEQAERQEELLKQVLPVLPPSKSDE